MAGATAVVHWPRKALRSPSPSWSGSTSVGAVGEGGGVSAADGDDRERPPGRRGGHPGHVGDVQLGHRDQLVKADSVDRVGVRGRIAFGGDGLRELQGEIPLQGRVRLQESQQITEHRRKETS